MLSVSWLLVLGLAVWRITNILHQEKLFEPVRKFFGVDDTLPMPENISFKYLLSCFMCLSVWVGIICTILYFIFPYILLPFALSAVAIYIDQRLWEK